MKKKIRGFITTVIKALINLFLATIEYH